MKLNLSVLTNSDFTIYHSSSSGGLAKGDVEGFFLDHIE
jgi:hypothetical protein